MTKFFISADLEAFRPEIAFVLNTWGRNQRVAIAFSESPDGAVLVGGNSNLVFSDPLQPNLSLSKAGLIEGKNGRPDYLTSVFYLINSLQEIGSNDLDELGRFRYSNSYQHRLGNSKDNVVQRCFDEISKSVGTPVHKEKSSFFLSHDIDMVNGAVIEDGFNVLKKGRFDLFLKMILNVAMGNPDWLNMDKIMKLESEYDCKSVFFWIVNKGQLNKREKNADYDFRSDRIQREFRSVDQHGFENGIHKSISSETFKQEFVKYGTTPIANRYHYLKFNLPQAYHDIAGAGLALDASLGFAEEIGFRNSYGLPFNPYDFTTRKPFSFVEVPLHVMDRTYFQYKKYSVMEAEKDILDFFEKNKENSVLSILWHNNFFTDFKFKGYLSLYKKILSYIKDNQFKTLSQKEIINHYAL